MIQLNKKNSTILTICTIALVSIFLTFCQKDDSLANDQLLARTSIPIQMSLTPCDSLQNVVWGDTLKVVKGTVIPGVVKKGKYKGKKYWFAALYSDALIDPANFVNDPKQHIVIADTTLITNDSKFIIARIK